MHSTTSEDQTLHPVLLHSSLFSRSSTNTQYHLFFLSLFHSIHSFVIIPFDNNNDYHCNCFLNCTPFGVSVELASLINLREEDCPYLLHVLLEVLWSLFNGQVFNQVSLSHQRRMWLSSGIVCFSLGAPSWVSLCLVHNVLFSYTSGIKHGFPPKELLCNTFFSFGLNVLSMSFLHK